MTHQERLLWLAEREKDCLHPNPQWIPEHPDPGCEEGKWKCSECGAEKTKAYRQILEIWTGGTGKVPKFPMLREECPNCRGQITESKNKDSNISCSPCANRGWIPVDNLEATLQGCISAGYSITFPPGGQANSASVIEAVYRVETRKGGD